MGVLGLWQILNSTGRPVTLESLENHILAVDVSIWMNQAVRGVRERRGVTMTDAYLLVMFHRICKLLHYRIKPIFVFDGAPPALKQRVLERRRRIRSSANEKVQKLSLKLMENLIHQQAVGSVLTRKSGKTSPTKIDPAEASSSRDIFALPEEGSSRSPLESSDSDEDATVTSLQKINFEKFDVDSQDFKALTPEIRHEILLEMQAQRKRPSWKFVDQLPKEAEKFSSFQLDRLMKKRTIQRSIDQTAKEMNSRRTELIMGQMEDKVDHLSQSQKFEVDARRIASSDTEHYLLFKRKSSQSSSVELENCAEDLQQSSSETEDVQENSPSPLVAPSTDISSPFDSNPLLEIQSGSPRLENESISWLSDISPSRNTNLSPVMVANSQASSDISTPSQADFSNLNSSGVSEMKSGPISEKDIDVFSKSDLSAGGLQSKTDTVNQSYSSTASFDEEIQVEHVAPPPNKRWDSSDSDSDFEVVPEKTDVSSPLDQSGIVHDTSIELTDIFSEDFSSARKSASEVVVDLVSSLPEENSSSKFDLDPDMFPLIELEDEAEMGDSQPELSVEDLQSLQMHLQNEGRSVRAERSKEEQMAASVTEQLRMDCQELLQLFGIPFVNSPGEAEAQCAFMDSSKQTHGTITDDSDVWLFGARKVYKNFFNKKEHVESYTSADIQSQLGLNQDKIIAFGMLTGSDYTEGIAGVGGIRALEIIAEFGGTGIDSLRSFRKWYDDVRKRREKGDLRPESKLRSQLADLVVPDIFPDDIVVQAYQEPNVDQSNDKFTWGIPALDLLREYSRRKFGWKKEKVDEILLPIIKRLNSRETQTHLQSYFSVQLKRTRPGITSRRLGDAIKKIKRSAHSAEEEQLQPSTSTAKPQRMKRIHRQESESQNSAGLSKPKQKIAKK